MFGSSIIQVYDVICKLCRPVGVVDEVWEGSFGGRVQCDVGEVTVERYPRLLKLFDDVYLVNAPLLLHCWVMREVELRGEWCVLTRRIVTHRSWPVCVATDVGILPGVPDIG